MTGNASVQFLIGSLIRLGKLAQLSLAVYINLHLELNFMMDRCISFSSASELFNNIYLAPFA